MGLFSKKKKPSAADAAAAEQARIQQAAAAAQAEQARKEAAAKAAANEEKSKEEKILTDISAKRKDIQMVQRALQGFEEERKREVAAASKARAAKKETELKMHLRNMKRLKDKLNHHENLVVQYQSQLDALEDAAFQRQGLQNVKNFTANMDGLKQDAGEIEEVLGDMREAMSGVNDINLTLQADAEMNKGIYDTDEALAELDELENELAEDAAVEIPSVPGETPKLPTAAASASVSEEEEIRRLEAGVGL